MDGRVLPEGDPAGAGADREEVAVRGRIALVVAVAALFLVPVSSADAADDRILVAVIPDTQTESYKVSAARARWIAHRDFDAIAHVGDVTDWGVRDLRQFNRAKRWMSLLPDVPRAVAIGNHDTAAVGIGGSAFDPPKTGELLRDTSVFNTFNLPTPANGVFEEGKVDNSWIKINRSWSMLTLELWARPEAIAWADKIVKSRPKVKWIVVTHSCLNSRGRITNNRGYGATSPAYLRDKLVRPNRNVRLVLCGHIGKTAVTRDKHATWILTNRTTPGRVRVVEINGTKINTWLRR